MQLMECYSLCYLVLKVPNALKRERQVYKNLSFNVNKHINEKLVWDIINN